VIETVIYLLNEHGLHHILFSEQHDDEFSDVIKDLFIFTSATLEEGNPFNDKALLTKRYSCFLGQIVIWFIFDYPDLFITLVGIIKETLLYKDIDEQTYIYDLVYTGKDIYEVLLVKLHEYVSQMGSIQNLEGKQKHDFLILKMLLLYLTTSPHGAFNLPIRTIITEIITNITSSIRLGSDLACILKNLVPELQLIVRGHANQEKTKIVDIIHELFDNGAINTSLNSIMDILNKLILVFIGLTNCAGKLILHKVRNITGI
jgi:hypothetical protein